MREPSAEHGPLRLADDLTDAELDGSSVVRNALVLLYAAGKGAGLELTARGYLTPANVAAHREAMHWPGCAFEERRRAGKRLGEAQVGELRLVRALLEEARCVETTRGDRLRASRRGLSLLAGARGALYAELFRLAFWRLSLNLFGTAECGSWPQQQVDMALWALSTTGDRFQGTRALMVLSVLPDEAVSRRPEWVAATLFAWRVLRPLWRTSTTRAGARACCSTGSSASGGSSRGPPDRCTDEGGGASAAGAPEPPVSPRTRPASRSSADRSTPPAALPRGPVRRAPPPRTAGADG